MATSRVSRDNATPGTVHDVSDEAGAASIAAIGALDTSALADGSSITSADNEDQYTLDKTSVDAALGDEILVPAGPGRLYRRLRPNYKWMTKYAASGVYVDPVNGNNRASGLSGSPLKSIAELRRRLPFVNASVTVNIAAGVFPATDNLQWEPALLQDGSALPIITLAGTRTLGADNTVVSSSDETVNAAPLVDIGIALTPGDMLQATSGASNGQTTTVLALIAGTQYRVAPWALNAFSRGTPPAVGDKVAIVTAVSSFSRIAVSCQWNSLIISNCKFTDFDIRENYNLIFRTCIFGTGALSMVATGQMLAQGCSFQCSSIGASSNSSAFKAQLCGFLRTGKATPNLLFGGSAYALLSNCVIQGGGIDLGGAVSGGGGRLSIARTGIFNAAGYALDVRNGAYADVIDTLYGSGSANGTRARDAGTIAVFTGLVPTLAATGRELTLEGSADPLNWAAWAAAPYSSNAFDMTKGSRIITRG